MKAGRATTWPDDRAIKLAVSGASREIADAQLDLQRGNLVRAELALLRAVAELARAWKEPLP